MSQQTNQNNLFCDPRWIRLGDIVRGDKDFVMLQGKHFYAVLHQTLNCHAQQDIPAWLDHLSQSAQVLKNGATCFVYKTPLGNRTVVIKRYNPKGFWHSVRHTLKGSRAKRGFVNAYRLIKLDIPTPPPLGFVEEWAGKLVRRSWLITEYVEGPKFFQYLAQKDLTKQQKTDMIDKLFSILMRLDQNRITHGDLKYTNIVISAKGPVLTDLDSLKIHRTGLFYAYHRRKDQSDAMNWLAMFGK